MTIFSSRGPNPSAPDILKPDITAPGLQILAGASEFPDPGLAPPGELFQAIAGTSMSSPVMAGVYALIKQAHPNWTPAMAKSAVMTTARAVKDNDRTTQAGPFAMGSGEARPGRVSAKSSAFNPGLVYDVGQPGYLGFLCGAAPEVFGPDAEATCGELAAAGVPFDAVDLNYPSIGVSQLAGIPDRHSDGDQRGNVAHALHRLGRTAAGLHRDGDTCATPAPAGRVGLVRGHDHQRRLGNGRGLERGLLDVEGLRLLGP